MPDAAPSARTHQNMQRDAYNDDQEPAQSKIRRDAPGTRTIDQYTGNNGVTRWIFQDPPGKAECGKEAQDACSKCCPNVTRRISSIEAQRTWVDKDDIVISLQ